MEHRSPADAARAFRDALQLAVSCVTRDVLSRGGPHSPAALPHVVFLPRAPVALSGQLPLSLEIFAAHDELEDPLNPGTWIARTLGYRYQLALREGPELLAFHWHPQEPNPIKFPHVHIGAAAQSGFAPLARAHIPTGIVPLHNVLRFAIQDLAVRPLRRDWQAILSSM